MAVSRCFENYVCDHRAGEDLAFLPIRHHAHELQRTMGTVRAVNSRSEFDTLLNATKSPTSLLVVDFWATWCQPCIQSKTASSNFSC